MTNKELVESAKEAMEGAYAPYSGFHVGAALLAASGKTYLGCNVENASYGATICAERTALVKAVSEGERHFMKMAIVGSSGGNTYPCGICLQVMAEFFYDGTLVFENSAGEIREMPVRDLLPMKFDLEDSDGN